MRRRSVSRVDRIRRTVRIPFVVCGKKLSSGIDRTIEPYGLVSEASAVSAVDGLGFQVIRDSLDVADSSHVTVPALAVALSDSRHYAGLSKSIYRFRLYHVRPDDVARFHGINERIAVGIWSGVCVFTLPC